MTLVRATHAVYGTCSVPYSRVLLHPDEWTLADADADVPEFPGAPLRARRVAGHRLVGLGDSITAAGGYLTWLAALSGGRVRLVGNAGVGGNQIPQMLARFDADVTPHAPTMVSLLAGTNDFTFGTTEAQFHSRVRAFVSKVRSISATPLLFTAPPCEALPDADRAKIPRVNAWLAAYAASEGIALVDAYAVLADPVGFGNYMTSYDNGDGIHPSAAGHHAVGQAAAAVLDPLLPPVPAVTATNGDPSNLLTNGLLKDDSGDGWADNWGQVWGLDAGTWTYSIVADPAVPGGTLQRNALTAATGHVSRHQDVAGGFAAGDQLRLTGLVTTAAGGYGALAWAAKNGSGSDLAFGSQRIDQAATRALADLTFTVPVGTATLRIAWDAGTTSAGTTANVDVGALTLRNETTLGMEAS